MSKLEDVFGEVTSLAAADVPPPAAQLQEATDAALRISLMMATAILYDSVLLFDKEVLHIWPHLRAKISWIYLLNRYTGLVFQCITVLGLGRQLTMYAVAPVFKELFLHFHRCFLEAWMTPISYAVTVGLNDYVILQRVLALYFYKRTMRMTLSVIALVEALTGLALIFYATIVSGSSVNTPYNETPICISSENVPISVLAAAWSLPLTLGTISLTLAVYKAIQDARDYGSVYRSPLMRVLVRDQAVYFVVLCLCAACELEAIVLQRGPAGIILDAASSPAVLCLLGARLFLNLKEVGRMETEGGGENKTLSSINFAISVQQTIS